MTEKGGKFMTTEELDAINLECDLIGLINQHAWPHGDKIAKKLLESYNIKPKYKKTKIPVAKRKKDAVC